MRPERSAPETAVDEFESRRRRARKSFWLALLASLTLHSVALFIGYASSTTLSKPGFNPDQPDEAPHPRLVATLGRPARPLQVQPSPANVPTPVAKSKKAAVSTSRRVEPKTLDAPSGVWAKRSWSKAERDEMNQFLSELGPQAATGKELAQQALAQARQMGKSLVEEGVDAESKPAAGSGKAVDPYSLEMYFDAFLRKLNRSAPFVDNERRVRGTRHALVEISLNADGSLRGYRVLRAGDQAAEIAYVKRVVDRAAPFSAFPPDIRKREDFLTFTMCIYPPREGAGGGFTRSFDGGGCKD